MNKDQPTLPRLSKRTEDTQSQPEALKKKPTIPTFIIGSSGLLLIILLLAIAGYLVYKNDLLREQVTQELVSWPTSSTTSNLTITPEGTNMESGLKPEDASQIAPIEKISLMAEVTSKGVFLRWIPESKPFSYNYFSIYRRIRNSNSWGRKERLSKIEVKQDYQGFYEYVDTSVTAGNKYSFQIGATRIWGKYMVDYGSSNIIEINF
jgi:hypothetical protein